MAQQVGDKHTRVTVTMRNEHFAKMQADMAAVGCPSMNAFIGALVSGMTPAEVQLAYSRAIENGEVKPRTVTPPEKRDMLAQLKKMTPEQLAAMLAASHAQG